MARLLTTYALVRTLYERGEDYVDAFTPLVVKTMCERKESATPRQLQAALRARYGLPAPVHAVRVIATRATRRGFIRLKDGRYFTTEKGQRQYAELEPDPQVQKRIERLVERVRVFLNEKGYGTLSAKQTEDELTAFVYENIESLVHFFSPTEEGLRGQEIPRGAGRYAPFISEFARECKDTDRESIALLEEIALGAVVTSAASSTELADMRRKFGNITVYLDTNFIFSLLQLHHPDYSLPAKELHALLKDCGFDVRVFDFTLDEAAQVLTHFPDFRHRFLKGVRVASVYSRMDDMGMTVVDSQELIARLDGKLRSLGVELELTGVDVEKLDYPETTLDRIRAYKPGKGDYSLKHDLAAIDQVRLKRGRPRRSLERSGAFFLTSDLKLSKYNFVESGHRSKGTVCECMPDRLVANVLWLKNPDLGPDVPLRTAVAIHAQGLLIDRSVWERFYACVQQLRKSGDIDEKDLSLLVYNHQIERTLLRLPDAESITIDKVFVVDLIKKARDEVNVEIKEKLSAVSDGLRRDFAAQQTAVERKHEVDMSRTLADQKKRFRLKADEDAKRYANWVTWAIALGVGVAVFLVGPTVVRLWNTIEPYAWLISLALALVLGLLGRRLSIAVLRRKLVSAFSRRTYARYENLLTGITTSDAADTPTTP